MSKVTEKEVRAILEYAISQREPEAARVAISVAMADGVELHKMTDLHFSLMLLLAAPEPEKRGRPKDPDAEMYLYYLNLACKIRAQIDEKTFSYTWAAYCDRARPKATDDELWRCAAILEHLSLRDWKGAKRAMQVFQLTLQDLQPFKL